MRYLPALQAILSVTILCGLAHAQSTRSSTFADQVDASRIMIAKLDHATQDDPPPTLASTILVRTHQAATAFLKLADSFSEELRAGRSPGASEIFGLYTQFVDLFSQYDFFVDITGSRKLELESVRSAAMAKEYFATKTYLEVAAYAELSRIDEELHSCRPARPR